MKGLCSSISLIRKVSKHENGCFDWEISAPLIVRNCLPLKMQAIFTKAEMAPIFLDRGEEKYVFHLFEKKKWGIVIEIDGYEMQEQTILLDSDEDQKLKIVDCQDDSWFLEIYAHIQKWGGIAVELNFYVWTVLFNMLNMDMDFYRKDFIGSTLISQFQSDIALADDVT